MTNDYEFRKPPRTDALVAAARSRPGAWVYDIDRAYPPEQPVPSEAIVGGWEVDAFGNLSGRFARNARDRPVERCTRPLKPYVHAAAKSNRDQWIVEIDERGESSFPDIPAHFIRGWWYVDVDGRVTDQFRPNSRWEPAPITDEIISAKFGAEVLLRDGHHYIRYDAGGIAVRMKELRISAADAERARWSERDARQVILSAEQADPTRVGS